MMRLERVQAQQFASEMEVPHFYSTAAFTELNRHKAADVHYLLFGDGETRLGIILGETDEALKSPFSAPFGGLCQKKKQRLETIDEAVRLLRDYGRQQGKKIQITLPPLIYNEPFITNQLSAFSRHGSIRWMDVNYHFTMARFQQYMQVIGIKARQKLKHAMKEDFQFRRAETESDIRAAYEVIRQNRRERGYQLRMSLEDVLDTIRVIPADFFLLSYRGVCVAAAQVFRVTRDIYQLIYWGNLGEYSAMRPMNLLAYRLFEYYYNCSGVHVLGIGPSSQEGEPNYGLIDFKEGVGCQPSCKCSFEL